MTPSSAARRAAASSLLVLAAGVASACDQLQPGALAGLQSLAVTMKSPAPGQLGSRDQPLAVEAVTVDVEALDSRGRRAPEDLDLDVYLARGGVKFGLIGPCGGVKDTVPLAPIHLDRGVARDQDIHLLRPFGRVNLWLEEHLAEPDALAGRAPRAFGASPPMLFHPERIADVVTPLDLASPTALYCSPFTGQQIDVADATGAGRLVVTSVFTNAYVVADSGAPFDGATGQGGFNHLYAFGRPPAGLAPGRIVRRLGGNVTKFSGFTELNNPTIELDAEVAPALVPAPYELTAADRAATLRLLRLVAATVKVRGKVCSVAGSTSWDKYSEFSLDLGDGQCDSRSTFTVSLPGKGLFDAAKKEGATATFTGMLKISSGQKDAQTPPHKCAADGDCAGPGLDGTRCVEGSCKKAAFAYFSVVVRGDQDLGQ